MSLLQNLVQKLQMAKPNGYQLSGDTPVQVQHPSTHLLQGIRGNNLQAAPLRVQPQQRFNQQQQQVGVTSYPIVQPQINPYALPQLPQYQSQNFQKVHYL